MFPEKPDTKKDNEPLKIKYEVHRTGSLKTPCPHGITFKTGHGSTELKIPVASLRCRTCDGFVSINDEERIVLCKRNMKIN